MKLISLSITILLVVFNVTAKDIYRWTDDKGVIHYSYKAPDNIAADKIKKMDMNKQGRYVNSSIDKSKTNQSQQELELERIAKKNCDIAKKNIQILTSFDNIQQKDSNGKLQTLTNEDKSQQLSLAKKQAAMFCKEETKASP